MNYAAQQWATDLAFFSLEATKGKRVNVIAPCGYSALENAKTLRWPQFEEYFRETIPMAIPLYDAAIYHSSMYKDYEFATLHGFSNSIVIPNGVDEDEFGASSKIDFRSKYGVRTAYVGLCVGNYYQNKGQDRVIDAVRQMGRKDFTMVFIGREGGLLPELRSRATGLNVKFLLDIPRADTIAAFHGADICLFGSQIEASPLVIIEAKASRTPFVSTDCGNVREWKGGIVCSPVEMASYANRLLDDAALRRRLAEEGYREWKEKLTWNGVVDRYEELYLSLHNKKKGLEAVPATFAENAVSRPGNKADETLLRKRLSANFRDVDALIGLAEIEMGRENRRKARNYVIGVMALQPENEAARVIWSRLMEGGD